MLHYWRNDCWTEAMKRSDEGKRCSLLKTDDLTHLGALLISIGIRFKTEQPPEMELPHMVSHQKSQISRVTDRFTSDALESKVNFPNRCDDCLSTWTNHPNRRTNSNKSERHAYNSWNFSEGSVEGSITCPPLARHNEHSHPPNHQPFWRLSVVFRAFLIHLVSIWCPSRIGLF